MSVPTCQNPETALDELMEDCLERQSYGTMARVLAICAATYSKHDHYAALIDETCKEPSPKGTGGKNEETSASGNAVGCILL